MAKVTLVTGGLGFIGQHVVDLLLARGDQVRVLDIATPEQSIPEVEYVTGSILDPPTVRRAMQDVGQVFHLAAVAGLWARRKQDLITVNQLGTRHVLEAARAAGVERVVHTSTEAILKNFRRPAKVEEITEAVHPTLADMPGPYCRGKFLAEQEALAATAQGLPVVVVNPTVPIGPGDRRLTPPPGCCWGFSMVAIRLSWRAP